MAGNYGNSNRGAPQPQQQQGGSSKIVGTRYTKRGIDKKGRKVLTVFLPQDQVALMHDLLGEALSNVDGARISLHTDPDITTEKGKKAGTFMFVEATQPSQKVASSEGAARPAYRPKATAAPQAGGYQARAKAHLEEGIE